MASRRLIPKEGRRTPPPPTGIPVQGHPTCHSLSCTPGSASGHPKFLWVPVSGVCQHPKVLLFPALWGPQYPQLPLRGDPQLLPHSGHPWTHESCLTRARGACSTGMQRLLPHQDPRILLHRDPQILPRGTARAAAPPEPRNPTPLGRNDSHSTGPLGSRFIGMQWLLQHRDPRIPPHRETPAAGDPRDRPLPAGTPGSPPADPTAVPRSRPDRTHRAPLPPPPRPVPSRPVPAVPAGSGGSALGRGQRPPRPAPGTGTPGNGSGTAPHRARA